MGEFTVYILKSLKTSKHYIGYTENIIKRLEQHNSGINRSTKSGIPWEVIYTESVFQTREDAMRREREIKSWKGGIKFKLLLNPRYSTMASTRPVLRGKAEIQIR